ncbi:MAG: DHH family phosphoesterase [Bacillota bacterium]|jgi:c-di-AMP phosphodiesterase-like protein|nr:DHH family phosphoesterase [Bacillota bacterium]
MASRLLHKIVEPYLKIDLIVMIFLSFCVLWFSLPAGILCLMLTFAVQVYHGKFTKSKTLDQIDSYEESMAGDRDEIARAFTENSPLLLSLIDMEGRLLWSNQRFHEVFDSEDSFYEKVDKKTVTGFFDKPERQVTIPVGDRTYRVTAGTMHNYDRDKKMLFWTNVTGYEIVKDLYGDQRPCVVFINIDNYDDLLASSPSDEQSSITAGIDKLIRNWAHDMDAAISRTRSNRYVMILAHRHVEHLISEKFPIINEIHKIETKADFPTSLSIGVGVGAKTLHELQGYAADALDLALGRGGDQAVIRRNGGDIEFFGGGLTTVEKRNKGKSRIVAHALQQLITTSNRVLIMGHVRPDMDSFGAAIGVYHMVKRFTSEVDIVLGEAGEAIESIYEAAVSTGRFSFVKPERALEIVRPDTLVVVVDTHIGNLTECPKLVGKTDKLVVIDHHRRSKEAIENATLTYMEVYASSTSELVAELLQYSGDRSDIGKFEAEALLAGITVDTKNFTVNTGVRTFEAASWLRRSGADIATVRGFFKVRLDFFQKKVNLIASAEILENGVAIAYTKDYDPAMQVLTSQVADELLDMKGVQAAFVAGRGKNITMLSGRSMGQINVQTILEKLGGGGHLTIAGAQLETSPEEAIHQVVQIMRDMEIL